MSSFSNIVTTKNGQALVANALAGSLTSLEFTKIRTSSTTYAESALESLTSLSNIKQEIEPKEVKRIGNSTVSVDAVLTNVDMKSGYILHTVGIYAKGNSGGEILFAVMIENAGGTTIPAFTDSSSKTVLEFQLSIEVGNSSTVTPTVNLAGLLTGEDGEKIVAAVHFNSNMIQYLLAASKNQQAETMEVKLTNTDTYPFNSSQTTISLETSRNTKDYRVIPEVVSYSGGFVGDVIVSDKLLNGFKVKYTGSATSVDLKLYIIGGFEEA